MSGKIDILFKRFCELDGNENGDRGKLCRAFVDKVCGDPNIRSELASMVELVLENMTAECSRKLNAESVESMKNYCWRYLLLLYMLPRNEKLLEKSRMFKCTSISSGQRQSSETKFPLFSLIRAALDEVVNKIIGYMY